MKITVPKISGFCYGVSLAIRSAEKVIAEGGRLLMYGEIVHNPHVVKKLTGSGARVIESTEDITEDDRKKNAAILIRAHGVPKSVQNELEGTGLMVIDSTCPKVKKVHDIVMREGELGRKIIIIGSEKHPEVKGILGWCVNGAEIVPDYNSALALKLDGDYSIVVQTTFNIIEFQRISSLLKEKNSDVKIFNTICPTTDIRQKQIDELSMESDFAIVVGGKNSSNSIKLCNIASRHCQAIQVENAGELDIDLLAGKKRVLVCAGSSTPIELVKETVDIISSRYHAETEFK